MKIGDLVKVETKFHGTKLGTIIGACDHARAWVVWIPNHWTSSTIVPECDMRLAA